MEQVRTDRREREKGIGRSETRRGVTGNRVEGEHDMTESIRPKWLGEFSLNQSTTYQVVDGAVCSLSHAIRLGRVRRADIVLDTGGSEK